MENDRPGAADDGAPRAHLAPDGGRFEVAGRAAPPPAPTEEAALDRDSLILKQGPLFACSNAAGDIDRARAGMGLYRSDTRFLSELRLSVSPSGPSTTTTSTSGSYEAAVRHAHDAASGQALLVTRRRLLEDRLYESIDLVHEGERRAAVTVEVTLAADFADILEVRGYSLRAAGGLAMKPRVAAAGVCFACVGEDDVWRQTRVRLDPPPDEVLPHEGRVTARWNVTLEPRGAARLRLAVEPLIGDDAPVDGGMAEAAARIERDERRWRDSSTRFAVDDRALDRVLQTSLNDARALMTPMDDGRIPAAGVPWFVCPFGRDSLIASYGLLSLATGPARETLLLLAARQATEDDPERDAEPGKILHELRYGELARAGYVPHRPYYGTADATPLFLIVAAAYHRWTADLKTMARLRPHFDAALAWIDEHGDRDGDGFVEYLRRAPRGGLQNQGWKDSATSMVHADGALAEGPIALCEVQAYVYAAKRAIADVYGALGERETAARLRGEAQRLRSAFHEAFWMPEEGTFALALDGSKRQLKSVTSNAGHCLFAGIVDADRAAAVVERSMAEDMFTGWGIRTLASTSASYDPTSYHNGSVWPHDSAMVAAGFKSYGFDAEARTVGAALLDAAAAADDLRLPELYSGLPRTGKRPERYAAACRPQAWAAVTPFFLLQTLLGIEADAPAGHLRIERPRLPERLGSVGVENLGVGPGRVHLRFESRGEATTVVESRAEGPVTVEILEPPAPA